MPVTTVEFPIPFEPERRGDHWYLERDGVEVKLSNLTKVLWPQHAYTKGDLLAAYDNLAPYLLPYLHDRPLTLRRMPDGIDGNEFYEKQAPAHTPDWVPRAYVEGHGSRGHIDFLMAQDAASLLFVANLGCIEMHPMHARQQTFASPDYLFFDLDPFPPIEFSTVRRVAVVINEALAQLGIVSVSKISGATGIVIYVPLAPEQTYVDARSVVERICRLVHRAFPEATTMAPRIADRSGKVYLDFAMVSEGRNIASVYSVRPTIEATIGMPVTWDEMRNSDVRPEDFTIRTVWDRLRDVGDLFEPMRAAGTPEGHVLEPIMQALGVEPAARVADDTGLRSLSAYQQKRDFERTAEPAGLVTPDGDGATFLINKHHARRLHFDLRLERGGVLVSWAVPKGLPDEPNVRHLAVHTEDHPLTYAKFEGSIPEGEYGAGESRIYDAGTYDLLEWEDGKKVTFRLHGDRVEGEYHLVHTKGKDWIIFRSARDAPARARPSPPRLEVMLATETTSAFDDEDWCYEVKWDGVRTLASIEGGAVRLTSRRGRDVTGVYPELAVLGTQLSGLNALVDGEIVVLSDTGVPSFERIQKRFTTGRPSSRDLDRDPVEFIAFDLLWLDGESLLDQPLSERRGLLERHLVTAPRVQLSGVFPGTQGRALFDAARTKGLEGVVAKRLASTYKPGKRTRDWLKVKSRRDLDAVIIGWSSGVGSRHESIGSLLVAVYPSPGASLRYAGHVGTGFTARGAKDLLALLEPLRVDEAPAEIPADVDVTSVRWVRPELVAAVEYLEMTSQFRMRAASFKGLHADRAPAECLAPPPIA